MWTEFELEYGRVMFLCFSVAEPACSNTTDLVTFIFIYLFMHWYFVMPFSVPGSVVWTLPSSCNKTGGLFLLHWRLWEVSLGVITVNSSFHNTKVMHSWTFVTDSSSSDVFKLHTDKRNKFHGREFFLSASYSLSWTRNRPNVIESGVSLSLHKNSPLIPSQSSQIQSTHSHPINLIS
jgi:hypothetical protein